jgi:hypothetical protein
MSDQIHASRTGAYNAGQLREQKRINRLREAQARAQRIIQADCIVWRGKKIPLAVKKST